MGDSLRVLTPAGIVRFGEYLAAVREGLAEDSPRHLLVSQEHSSPFASIEIEQRQFADRFEFGTYLQSTLESLDRRAISRNCGLWTWLALYYFEQLCPQLKARARKVLADEAYILPAKYDFRSYYRHLVRTPWLAVAEHGENAKVLLIPAGQSGESPLATRGEIIEQLASRQVLLGSAQVIKAANRLYFDPTTNRPRRGAGGSKGGSPRRLALVLQQLDLTYDLAACDDARLLSLLPREFERWKSTP